jgi:hypothetical protein
VKRRLGFAVAAAVGLALGIALSLRSSHVAPRAPHEPPPVRTSVRVPELPVKRAPPAPLPPREPLPGSAALPDAGVLDVHEQGLLRMYDEMADAIEMSTDDCDAIEYAFATAIEGGAPHLKSLMQRAKASGSQQRDAKDPLLALAKERMNRLFAMLRKLSPECGRQLSGELRRLTEGKF